MGVVFHNGKILFNGSQVAMSQDCCCDCPCINCQCSAKYPGTVLDEFLVRIKTGAFLAPAHCWNATLGDLTQDYWDKNDGGIGDPGMSHDNFSAGIACHWERTGGSHCDCVGATPNQTTGNYMLFRATNFTFRGTTYCDFAAFYFPEQVSDDLDSAELVWTLTSTAPASLDGFDPTDSTNWQEFTLDAQSLADSCYTNAPSKIEVKGVP